jgi:hypothetical protein
MNLKYLLFLSTDAPMIIGTENTKPPTTRYRVVSINPNEEAFGSSVLVKFVRLTVTL